MIWPLAHPLSPLVSVSSTKKGDNLLTGKGEGGGQIDKLYDRMKAVFSINHSILSAPQFCIVEINARVTCIEIPLYKGPEIRSYPVENAQNLAMGGSCPCLKKDLKSILDILTTSTLGTI